MHWFVSLSGMLFTFPKHAINVGPISTPGQINLPPDPQNKPANKMTESISGEDGKGRLVNSLPVASNRRK